MFGLIHYSSFVASSLLLNMTPGADTIYILSRSATGGKKQGLLSALGISTGILIHTVLAAFGLSAVLAASALAFRIVKIARAAYLIFLGIRTIIAHNNPFSAQGKRDLNTICLKKRSSRTFGRFSP